MGRGASMAATRRLQKELADIRKSGIKSFREIQVDESNILTWQGLIVPENPPYNKGAFKIEVNFPAEYPFKPPSTSSLVPLSRPEKCPRAQPPWIPLGVRRSMSPGAGTSPSRARPEKPA